MPWDNGLLPEQRLAASHTGSHARMLAGPGTGKTLTLTRHVCFLVENQHVNPSNIFALTFTRAAAREIRQRVDAELNANSLPKVSTLHSFSLRQLLRNARRISELPQPLRIADDWEERNIIIEDLKAILGLGHINEARSLLNELSADWQSLTAEEAGWERRFPSPEFLGAWREHREIYGYTLRSELVYQLKKALEHYGNFDLEAPIQYLLVDEYQDLNRCDLAVVHQIASRGVELYIAGDDDQSIYGFRKAHPEGIRRFPRDYTGACDLPLEVCKRCDEEILNLGLFVARQDTRRIEKAIRAERGRQGGEVGLIRFRNQSEEAFGITRICHHLISTHGLQPDGILILLRSDHNAAFSNPLREQITVAGIPVTAATEATIPLDEVEGRSILAFMRLAVNLEDNLAWRTLFQVWCDGIGSGAVSAVYDIARRQGGSFAQALLAAHNDPNILPSVHRTRVPGAIQRVLDRLHELFPDSSLRDYSTMDDLMNVIRQAALLVIPSGEKREAVLCELGRTAQMAQTVSLKEIIRATEVTSEDIEQEIQLGKVNILTMHKAKGLTAEAVVITAGEDQYIPGRAQGDAIEDERRLLYVSLTRARHHLFVTYCDSRTGLQRYTGRDSGRSARSLTRFLTDSPYTPVDGMAFVNRLEQENA